MLEQILPEGDVVRTALGLTTRREGIIRTLRVEEDEGMGLVVIETRSAHAPQDRALLVGTSMVLDYASLQEFAVDAMAMAAKLRARAAVDAALAERGQG